MIKKKVSLPVVLSSVAAVGGSIGFFEWRALNELDHPKLHHVSCVGCHTNDKSIAKMGEKSGDSLYLVHRGDFKSGSPTPTSVEAKWIK